MKLIEKSRTKAIGLIVKEGTATKPHLCKECRSVINVGGEYRSIKGPGQNGQTFWYHLLGCPPHKKRNRKS
ncbi:MAG: hypothetical protein UR50_C0003G0034 [Parcubacteria group bacterium GW2011_GWC1_34_10]|uniref:PARP-type domain-containing protein n=1 Tax=Candidatus Zambryskibacteria bacterium RIFCSPLOWO2_01_FULL_35_19 TaxID=1802757 RepID=A0A1G2TYF0_9BACT|nr:MAG: hypothetical protein UR50_C0003G0034 [Parcubacteria group bacterium GW2011_GWC1_34_10]OHA86731.1 MAG: hypothetical protein A2726_00130 [Candidatus Zambryskibacteria bacterium RIFCSPHIGHO2_01_FULL_35_32]OHB02326.1 MAG: hypothetical protein A3A90_00835 [Candidatus Zambryskibacteria bacterium RIFCSPLOWO2_01_FULL_35_19]